MLIPGMSSDDHKNVLRLCLKKKRSFLILGERSFTMPTHLSGKQLSRLTDLVRLFPGFRSSHCMLLERPFLRSRPRIVSTLDGEVKFTHLG